MDRRDFLKTTSTVIAGATIAPSALSAKTPTPAADAGGRIVLPINRNWRYSKKYAQGAHGKDFDDSRFRPRRHSAHERSSPVAQLRR